MESQNSDTYIYIGFINEDNNCGLATSKEIYDYKQLMHPNIKYLDLTEKKNFKKNLSDFTENLSSNDKCKNLHIYLDVHGKENGSLSIERNEKKLLKSHIEKIICKLQPKNVKFTNYICHGGMNDLNQFLKKISNEYDINIIVSTPSIEHIIQPYFDEENSGKFTTNTCVETTDLSKFSAGKKYYFYNKNKNIEKNCQIIESKDKINEIKKQIGYKI